MEAGTAQETMVDNALHAKIVEAVKSYMNDPVTLVEGFVSVQLSGADCRHIHISYRDLSLEPDEDGSEALSRSPKTLSSPPKVPSSTPAPPKVSRRKAYMPVKCKALTDPADPEIFPEKKKEVEEEEEQEEEEERCSVRLFSPRPSSQLEHLLLPEPRPDPLILPNQGFAFDSDPIGPLNAETIQASVHQAMHSSYQGFLPPVALNAVIPLPTVASIQPRPKPEQRKIRPKPITMTACISNTGPYTKPPSLSKRHANKEFSCNQCDMKFKSLHSLTEHTTAVHICFRCTICSAKFTQRSNLQRHSLKHLGFKPFRCGVCLKEYYRKDHLVRHVEVSHPGSEPKATIVNILPSAECLRILEETQSKARAAQESVQPPKPSSDLLDLTGNFEELDEEEEEEEEEEEDLGMDEETALMFARHLALPLSPNNFS